MASQYSKAEHAERLTSEIEPVCPTHGAYIGDLANPATWGHHPKDEATQAEKDAADVVIQNFDPSDVAHAMWLEDKKTSTVGVTTIRNLVDNVSTTSATPVYVTGLSFTLKPNSIYAYKFVGAYLTAAPTTGIGLAVDGPANPQSLRMMAIISEGPTSARYGAKLAYSDPVRGLASGGSVPMPFWIEGTIHTGPTGGAFGLQVASEVAGSQVTVGAGTYAMLNCIE